MMLLRDAQFSFTFKRLTLAPRGLIGQQVLQAREVCGGCVEVSTGCARLRPTTSLPDQPRRSIAEDGTVCDLHIHLRLAAA